MTAKITGTPASGEIFYAKGTMVSNASPAVTTNKYIKITLGAAAVHTYFTGLETVAPADLAAADTTVVCGSTVSPPVICTWT